MAIDLLKDIRVDYLDDSLFKSKNIRLGILRLDEIHPLISGNKWFKLKENIRAARQNNKQALLTFGGAFSNHLVATAAGASLFGFSAVGVVRGLHAAHQLSPTLATCARLGMQLKFVSRAEYALKNDPDYLSRLQKEFPAVWIIPEGGNNEEGLAGAMEIAGLIPQNANWIALPIGTGTTFSGLRNALSAETHMLGFAGFKNAAYLKAVIRNNLKFNRSNWQFNADFHFGGFAKYTPELIHFINEFYRQFGIPLDFVYTGKMMFGLVEMIKSNQIPENIHLIAIHTGGLQGNCSIQHLLTF